MAQRAWGARMRRVRANVAFKQSTSLMYQSSSSGNDDNSSDESLEDSRVRQAHSMSAPMSVRARSGSALEALEMKSVQEQDLDFEALNKLNTLRELFEECDTDGTGKISQEELEVMIRRIYRREKMSRSAKAVHNEVDAAMRMHDRDGDAVLDFPEFVALVCSGNETQAFKFRDLRRELRERMRFLADSQFIAWSQVEPIQHEPSYNTASKKYPCGDGLGDVLSSMSNPALQAEQAEQLPLGWRPSPPPRRGSYGPLPVLPI